ncbi:hypothetical protein JO379_000078 [Streptomyces syringium]|uniref:Uncharacterized protein n=1 Tax=Streptomyces syringium TaxID=76729 RepID=A0ABS4XVR9_9ACTN|nr:hypothetical protein [Streptomyces syringium]MBP2400609.1 hypothetical protein [Streptomyces syringium]
MSTCPLVLDADAQSLLFREARTANAFSTEPVTDEQIQADYDLMVINIGRPGENAWYPRAPRLAYGQAVTTV